MIKIQGKNGIQATIIADSITSAGHRLTTLEIEVHRIIWSEFMTHRQLSRNAASSRAVPAQTNIDMVRVNPAVPIAFGKNIPGMQAKEDLQGQELADAIEIWRKAAMDACNRAQQLTDMGVHKQVVNRLLEPFTMMKAVVSFTEGQNFYDLRLHKDADPHIYELARCMHEAQAVSQPTLKVPGEWHVPYAEGNLKLEDALVVSASCCAQVSYRRLDTSLEKARSIYDKLVGMKPAHASPFEHQAMVPREDRNMNAPSRNFVGWTQYRSILGI